MEKRYKIMFIDTEARRLREFVGGSLNGVIVNAGEVPARIFSGWFNEADNCVAIDETCWVNTRWEIKSHGPYGHYWVIDPRGEKRFVDRNRIPEKGGIEFILYLITMYADWSDFDQRAGNYEKEYRCPFCS